VLVSGYSGCRDAKNGEFTIASVLDKQVITESVQSHLRSDAISYGQLLKIYFSVLAHDPTGWWSQIEARNIRSGYFSFTNDETAGLPPATFAQQSRPGADPGQSPHWVLWSPSMPQNPRHPETFLNRNPKYPYIVQHDLPKLVQLRKAGSTNFYPCNKPSIWL
jgi:peptide-methionine (S)-S-oxide reductase